MIRAWAPRLKGQIDKSAGTKVKKGQTDKSVGTKVIGVRLIRAQVPRSYQGQTDKNVPGYDQG